MKYKIYYDPAIPQQLNDIKHYINLGSATMGQKVVTRLREKMRSLTLEPTIGIPLKNKVNFEITKDVRFVIESNYYIFYFIESDFVYVYSVIHSSQNYVRFFDFLKE